LSSLRSQPRSPLVLDEGRHGAGGGLDAELDGGGGGTRGSCVGVDHGGKVGRKREVEVGRVLPLGLAVGEDLDERASLLLVGELAHVVVGEDEDVDGLLDDDSDGLVDGEAARTVLERARRYSKKDGLGVREERDDEPDQGAPATGADQPLVPAEGSGRARRARDERDLRRLC
jgi:hypothetical protein